MTALFDHTYDLALMTLCHILSDCSRHAVEWSRQTTAVVVATTGDKALLIIGAIRDGSQLTETVEVKVCFCVRSIFVMVSLSFSSSCLPCHTYSPPSKTGEMPGN